jgi:hypothetical protein
MTEGALGRSEPSGRADEPPALLHHAVDAAPPLGPVRADPAVSSMHQTWARMAAGDGSASGWRGKVERAMPGRSPADRELIGEVIRAADALAARCDQLSERVMALEGALAEVIEVLGADLVRLRAAVDGTTPPHD